MAGTLSNKGLLLTPEDDPTIQLGQLGGDPNNPGASAPVTSPFANTNPTLAGGAAGITRQDYGGAIAASGKQFPFNAKYAAYDQALQRAIANAGFDRTNALSSLDVGYKNTTAEAERQNQLAQTALTNRMSSQGLGFSGIKLGAAGDLTGDYNRYVGNLGQQYAGGVANTENQYGRSLGDIAAQREGLYAQQAEEERQARLEAARQAAEAKARQDEANRQYQLQQQMIAQQNAQYAQQQQWQQQQMAAMRMPSNPGIGITIPQYGVGEGASWGDVGNVIAGLPMSILTQLYSVPNLPDDLRTAVRKRIVDMNTPSSPNYYPQPVGYNDRPYGFDQGGVAL